jgi:hypothetical protein
MISLPSVCHKRAPTPSEVAPPRALARPRGRGRHPHTGRRWWSPRWEGDDATIVLGRDRRVALPTAVGVAREHEPHTLVGCVAKRSGAAPPQRCRKQIEGGGVLAEPPGTWLWIPDISAGLKRKYRPTMLASGVIYIISLAAPPSISGSYPGCVHVVTTCGKVCDVRISRSHMGSTSGLGSPQARSPTAWMNLQMEKLSCTLLKKCK